MKKKTTIENLMASAIPGGIEMQEAQGQKELCQDSVLPKEILYSTREDFEKLGIKFGKDEDDLFVKVKLPKGWKLEPTDHSMWSELKDERGKKMAAIFYKAAFYDRKAHMMLEEKP